jgi:transposase
MAIRVRSMTDEEVEAVKQLAHSRTEPACKVERARIVWLSHRGKKVAAIAEELRLHAETVRTWLKRFNAQGLRGLQDAPRSGRPATYSRAQVGEVIAAALTDPQALGLPFACWTLDRLEAYLNEQKGIAIKRSRIDDLLRAEGLRWRKEETWFGQRVDPDFAEKRGSLRSSMKRLRPRV